MSYDHDYYAILNLNKSCTIDSVKKAYHRLALEYHPDRNLNAIKDAEEKFRTLAEAYEILSNPTTRKEYDQSRTNAIAKKYSILNNIDEMRNEHSINIYREFTTKELYDGFTHQEQICRTFINSKMEFEQEEIEIEFKIFPGSTKGMCVTSPYNGNEFLLNDNIVCSHVNLYFL